MKRQPKAASKPASTLIDERIAELGDWRGNTLAKVRALIKEADPEVVEEWKWEIPTWYHDGGICTGESYKSVVKLTFFKGASLKDPRRLFNSSLDGNVRRAIDLREGEKIDAKAFRALIREAIALNAAGGKRARPPSTGAGKPPPRKKSQTKASPTAARKHKETSPASKQSFAKTASKPHMTRTISKKKAAKR